MKNSRTRCASFFAAGIAMAAFLLPGHGALADTFAIDGDDICVDGVGRRCAGGTDYRLYGIDAFEAGQTCMGANGQPYGCGGGAREALAAIINGRQVSCVRVKRDGGRLIGNCNAGGVDVEAEMVRSGWAFVRPDFIDGEREKELCAIEAEARSAKRGLWAGSFEQRPYFWKGGRKKTLVQISCPPHDEVPPQ